MTVSLHNAKDDIYGEVAGYSVDGMLPKDAVRYTVASMLEVHFVVDICDLSLGRTYFPICRTHLAEWNITVDRLFEIARQSAADVPDSGWRRLGRWTKAYAHPTYDEHWVPNILLPQRLLSLDLVGSPLVLVPDAESFLVTGDRDKRGQRILLRECRSITDRPLTPRPMVLNAAQEWEVMRDSKNRFARKYRRLFGPVESSVTKPT